MHLLRLNASYKLKKGDLVYKAGHLMIQDKRYMAVNSEHHSCQRGSERRGGEHEYDNVFQLLGMSSPVQSTLKDCGK